MRFILILAGGLLFASALFYFSRLFYLLLNHNQFTDYGYGILTGNILLLLAGTILLYFGIRRKKKQKSP